MPVYDIRLYSTVQVLSEWGGYGSVFFIFFLLTFYLSITRQHSRSGQVTDVGGIIQRGIILYRPATALRTYSRPVSSIGPSPPPPCSPHCQEIMLSHSTMTEEFVPGFRKYRNGAVRRGSCLHFVLWLRARNLKIGKLRRGETGICDGG